MSTDPRPDEAGERHDDVAPAAQDDTTAGPTEHEAAVAPGGPAEPSAAEEHAPTGPLPDPPSDVAHDAGLPSAGSPAHRGSSDDAWPADAGATGAGTTSAGTTSAHPAPGPYDQPAQPTPTSDAGGAEDIDDAALRAERARRFGRFGQARTEATEHDEEHEPVRTTALPTAAGTGTAGAGAATTALPASDPMTSHEPVDREPEIDESDPFDDWDDPPRSRAQAHWWVVLITLVFIPPAWYLITDGGERWLHAREVAPEAIHFGALIEIIGGLVVLAAVLISARWSSVGPIIVGSIAALIGGAFLAIPQLVEDFLDDYSHIFTQLGQFGQNVHDHLLADGNTGRILAYGVVLIFAGVISHGARRQGRREERRRAAVEAI